MLQRKSATVFQFYAHVFQEVHAHRHLRKNWPFFFAYQPHYNTSLTLKRPCGVIYGPSHMI